MNEKSTLRESLEQAAKRVQAWPAEKREVEDAITKHIRQTTPFESAREQLTSPPSKDNALSE